MESGNLKCLPEYPGNCSMSGENKTRNGFAASFLREVQEIAAQLDTAAIEKMAGLLASVREQSGRLFILGVGGSAANASHAVNDFRKLVGIESYAPTDNVSELTARTNDEGWPTVFAAWLQVSHLGPRDAVLVLSVGGGSVERNVSPNIVAALDYAKSVGAKTLGIVGRDGGYTASVADVTVIIPTVHPDRITPHSEAFQAVVWHLLVSHPTLQKTATKWESLTPQSLAPNLPQRAVFLDRDGVLNEAVVVDGKPFPPERVVDLRIPDGTAAALSKLKQERFLLLVVTNQPDVARGVQRREVVEDMGARLQAELPLDEVLTCFHDDKDNCDCRKPRPGLMIRAAHKYGLNLSESYLVGDRWKDIDAGANAGCRTILIDRGYSERAPASPPHVRVGSLPEAVEWILTDAGNHR
jgi:D-sedoheptulose 7-phosphate isomerase